MKKHWVLIIIILVSVFLRLYKIDTVPVSLFGDEMDVGYQAYSILKTGRDYYGNPLPLHFHSLAEWRTPLYLYAAVPTVALFGISPLGVRLPAAIFGILGVVAFYFLVRLIRQECLKIENWELEIMAALMLAISPWHIQYSRAGFEVTLMLFFLILGLYFFLRGLKESKYLFLSAMLLAALPWVYSTAKLFVPLLIVALVLIFWSDVKKVKVAHVIGSSVVFFLISLPMLLSILFGEGAQRFGYISVLTDPTVEHEIGVARDRDDWGNNLVSRIFHNKFSVWGEAIFDNFLKSFSTEFLFVDGDLNLRHSIDGVGMFYRVDLLVLLVGIVFFFSAKFDKRIKYLIIFWLVAGAIPAAITRDGGSHATRLILILPALVFLIALGVLKLVKNRLLFSAYWLLLIILFIQYQHLYWIHNPTYSERWWHYGWEEAVETLKEHESDYETIIISTADEPPWVFFAGAYEYPPSRWQREFPLHNKVDLAGFGEVSYIDKYYFGSPKAEFYNWGRVIDGNTLYLASIKEVSLNLVKEPERTPGDLKLIETIMFPSGEPAFYVFSGVDNGQNI